MANAKLSAPLPPLTLRLDLLAEYLTEQPADTTLKETIITYSTYAINRVLDASPHENQEVSISCMEKLGELMESYPNTSIQLLWLPRTIKFVGSKRARQLAFEAIRTAIPNPEDEPHTINRQKKKTKESAIATWAERWHEMPRTSLAYRTALTKPPDGRTHPTFPIKKDAAKFSHTTYCTLYRIITGHAFTGEYTQRFYKQQTPEQIVCPCGEPVQTVEHVLLTCPIYAAARRRHLTANGRPQPLPRLFDHPKRVHVLLRFLEETGVCENPRTEWEPG